MDYVTHQHNYSFNSIEEWPLDAAVIYRPTDRASLLPGNSKAACSLQDIVETSSLKVTVVVTMCAREMEIQGAPTDWTQYFQQQEVFHIKCQLEDTTLKPAKRWLEKIPDLAASCLFGANPRHHHSNDAISGCQKEVIVTLVCVYFNFMANDVLLEYVIRLS